MYHRDTIPSRSRLAARSDPSGERSQDACNSRGKKRKDQWAVLGWTRVCWSGSSKSAGTDSGAQDASTTLRYVLMEFVELWGDPEDTENKTNPRAEDQLRTRKRYVVEIIAWFNYSTRNESFPPRERNDSSHASASLCTCDILSRTCS